MTPIRIRVFALLMATGVVLGPGMALTSSLGPAGSASALGPGSPVNGSAASAGEVSLPSTAAYGSYIWPVRGPVIRGFEEPSGPYSAGHRGIDIGAPFGSDMVAAADGVVSFSGWVAGALYISIDHPDGVRTTYSWISASRVHKGQVVQAGQVIGSTGHGHPSVSTPHLHFGARVGSTYIDPMLLLGSNDVVGLIHLAPLAGPSAAGRFSQPPDALVVGASAPTRGRDPPLDGILQ